MMSDKTMTAGEIANELGIDAKACRRFLRDIIPAEMHPSKGGRWHLDASMIDALKDRFARYSAKQARIITINDLID